jgi:hypothetical protein
MTTTRIAQVSIGPFSAPLGPVSAAIIHRFIGEVEINGWIAVAGQTDEGLVITAVRVEPARTVRQRVTKPAPTGKEVDLS